jgi:PiT family inorganic phosphate transporter
MDIKTIKTIESATEKSLSSFAKLSFSLLFLLAVFLWTYSSHGKVPDNTFLIIGAIFGAYMALNIGANDVANNVGPAVGAKALTLNRCNYNSRQYLKVLVLLLQVEMLLIQSKVEL